jgi:hypothetical protein
VQGIERLLVFFRRRIDIGQQGAGELCRDVHVLRRLLLDQPPGEQGRSHEHRQHQQDGRVELQVEALH